MSGKTRKNGILLKDVQDFMLATENEDDQDMFASCDEEDDQQSVGSSAKENNKVSPIKIKRTSDYMIDKKVDSKNKQDTYEADGDKKRTKPRTPLKAISRDPNGSKNDDSPTKRTDPNPTKLTESPVKSPKLLKSPTRTLESSEKRNVNSELRVLLERTPLRQTIHVDFNDVTESPKDSPSTRSQETDISSNLHKLRIKSASNTPTRSTTRATPKKRAALETKPTDCDIASSFARISVAGGSPGSDSGETPKKRVRTSRKPIRYHESCSDDEELAVPLRKPDESSSPQRTRLGSDTGVTLKKRSRGSRKPTRYRDSSLDDELVVPLGKLGKSSSPQRTRPRRNTQPPERYQSPQKITPTKTTPSRCGAPTNLNSPRTQSLRRRTLEANTPRSSLAVKRIETELTSDVVRSVKKKLDLTPKTPRSARKVGRGFLSPIVPGRTGRGSVLTPSSLDLVRSKLHASSLPKCLPCREKEFNNIKSFIERKISDGAGGCMYISGVPGTGKTASVHSVIKCLQEQAQNDEIPFFDFVEINGLRLTQPKEAYARIWQTLTDQKLSTAEALNCLEKKFLKSNKRSTILLVDELDYLCNRRQDVIYNILDWSTQRHSKLVVLTIANTMDLPERTLKGKVTSRMGLTRLVFQPYSFKQLGTIVSDRLAGSSSFQTDAVQLVVRKVAAVSGDARRALDICRRATDTAEADGREIVTVGDVETTLIQIFKGSRVMAVKHCSKMAQFILRALRDEVLRTGVEESSIRAIFPQIVAICAFEGVREPTSKDVLTICSQLNDSGLIVAEKGRKDLSRKLSLNISGDDIHFALNL